MTEYIKSIVIAVLFAGVLVMSGMYIVSLNNSEQFSSDEVTFEKLRAVQDSETNASILAEIITPRFIGVKAGGKEPSGISAGSEYIREIYREIGIYLYYAMIDGAEIESVAGGDSAEIWIETLTSYSYIYIKYHSPLPYQLIQASGGSIYGSECTDYTRKRDAVIYINDLFIIPENGIGIYSPDKENPGNMKYQVLIRDFEGNVYRCTPPVYEDAGVSRDSLTLGNDGIIEDGAAAGQDNAEILYPGIIRSVNALAVNLSNLYEGNMQKYHFADKTERENETYTDPASVIVTENIPVKLISVKENSADTIFSDTERFDKLMTIFNFNPNNLSTYYDESGKTQIYVERHGVLKISSGRIVYTARDGGGIPVSDYIGYNASGAPEDIYDITAASQKLIKGIIETGVECAGKNADLRISGVYAEGDRIRIEYSYYYDNFEIMMSESEYGILIESDGVKITAIDFYTLSADIPQYSPERILSYTQNWAAEKYISESFEDYGTSSVKINEMFLVYPANTESADVLKNGEGKYIIPEWYISVQTPGSASGSGEDNSSED